MVAIIVLLLIGWPQVQPAAEDYRIGANPRLQAETTLRSVDWQLLQQRLLLDSGDSRLFVSYGMTYGTATAAAGGELQYLSGGVRTPQLIAGTVQPGGLLREINRPTRFSSASDVYRQAPGLMLNSAIEPGRRYGLQVQPWQAAPALFGVLNDNASQSLGVHWSLGDYPLQLRTLLLTTDAPADSVDDHWYTEYPRFSGGRVNHLSGEARLQGQQGHVALAAIGSGGPLTAGAAAGRIHAGYRATGLSARALWALSQPGYVTPEGRFWRDRQHRAVDLRLGRTRGGFVELEAAQRLTRAPLRRQRSAPQRTHYAALAGVNEIALSGVRLSAAAGGAQTTTRDDRAREGHRVRAESRLAIRAGRTAARISAQRRWQESRHEHDRLELSASRGGMLALETILVATLQPRQQARYQARAEARLRAGRMLLFARVATLKENTLDEVAAWQSVPLSVTVGGTWRFDLPQPVTTLQPSALRVPE